MEARAGVSRYRSEFNSCSLQKPSERAMQLEKDEKPQHHSLAHSSLYSRDAGPRDLSRFLIITQTSLWLPRGTKKDTPCYSRRA